MEARAYPRMTRLSASDDTRCTMSTGGHGQDKTRYTPNRGSEATTDSAPPTTL